MTVEVRHRCRDPAEAERLLRSLRVDDPTFVTLATEERELVVRVEAPSAARARATLEDLLACLAAAERTADRLPGG